MSLNTDLFYSRLPVNMIPLSDLFLEEHLFFKIPDNWHVVITDVKDSTQAVNDGLHETVNLVATGSIVAVLNISFNAGITVPFFFGGDGASFIIPPEILQPVLSALMLHRENVQSQFNLDLRVGHVTVSEVYKNEKELKISKLKTSANFEIPVLLGEGLMFAENKIKGADYQFGGVSTSKQTLNLDGMQCRWDKIKPPENYSEVVSLLVLAQQGVKQSVAFKKVMDSIETIYGTPQARTPISVRKLKLNSTLAKIGQEMRVKMRGFRPFHQIATWLKTSLGHIYFETKQGKVYLENLVEMSDTLVIDGRINTVISGTTQQRKSLEAALDKIEKDGEIVYGLYVSKESVMSCYVRNMEDQHIHFVDGSEGGYTNAAGMIKRKLRVQN